MPNNFPDEAEKIYIYILGPNSSTIGATESTLMTWMDKIEMVASADACTAHMQEAAQKCHVIDGLINVLFNGI